mmetsp:Transcript_32763/g.49378  ORF Transcript_32763/g.49378 Transcript_32763/m.49378 type:complete len:317 (+) Transcript_32763:339-1289(+)
MYDCCDYIRTFGYLVPESFVPKDLNIPFDIVNAKSMQNRSNNHYVHTGRKPQSIYKGGGGSKNFHLEPMKKTDVQTHPNQYWKHEVKTLVLECSYEHQEEVAPFDELYLVMKIITSSCHPGTELIRFNFKKDESFFDGMKKSFQGFYPKPGTKPDTMNNDVTTGVAAAQVYSRLYIWSVYTTRPWECLLSHYVIPYLLFVFMVVGTPDQHPERLVGIASTLVVANVALLIVSDNRVFSYKEQAVLLQIVLVVGSTFFLVIFGYHMKLRIILGCIDGAILIILLLLHPYRASQKNKLLLKKVKTEMQGGGRFFLKSS